MAKHYKKRSRRGYGAFLPKLSDIKGSVKGTDVLIGIGVGIAGLLAVRYYVNTRDASKLPSFLQKDKDGKNFILDNIQALGPILGGLIGYAAAKKWKPGMANSVLVGSLGGGLALFGLKKLESYKMKVDGVEKPVFAGLSWGDYGILAPDAPFGILAQDNYGRREAELDQMAAFAAQNDLDEVLS